jgi:hypothetical protein
MNILRHLAYFVLGSGLTLSNAATAASNLSGRRLIGFEAFPSTLSPSISLCISFTKFQSAFDPGSCRLAWSRGFGVGDFRFMRI